MVAYEKVYWLHNHPDEPSVFFYEYDGEDYFRVIELFDTGCLKYACAPKSVGRLPNDSGAHFPDQPRMLPTDEDFPEEFKNSVFEITEQQFEATWSAAVAQKR